jgi:DNA-binding NtrC family response regulator
MLTENTSIDAAPAGTLPDTAEKHAARVLVVDDEWLVRWAVTEALQADGFDVVEASDAAAARRALGADCDLVLLDLHLPDSVDLGLLSFIRQQAPALPVILMTAFATREIAEEASLLGATIVPKPFDLNDLTRAVESVLSGRVY